jgi:hypothetical protein
MFQKVGLKTMEAIESMKNLSFMSTLWRDSVKHCRMSMVLRNMLIRRSREGRSEAAESEFFGGGRASFDCHFDLPTHEEHVLRSSPP